MDFFTIIIILAYLAITAALGYLGYSRTKNASDYLLAGRQVHPLIMAVSYGATFISTSAIVGFGGAAAKYGMGVLWLTVLNIFVGIFIAFVVFGKRTRRIGHALDAHTFPELLGKRYDSTFIQVACGVVIFVGMPLYAGAVMLGGATYLVQALSISKEVAILILVLIVTAYVMFGGMKGVMYTDAFQGGIMFIGMIILLFTTYSVLGGVSKAHEKLAALPALLTDPKSKGIVDSMTKDGFRGWMSMPAFGTPVWMQLVSTIVLGVGIGVLAQPQLVVRFMTVKSDRELNRGVAIGGTFILMMTGVAFVTGALSNVLFYDKNGMIALAMTITDKTPKGNPDAVIPNFIKSALPWFNSVFMVTLLAAAMSTMSSQIHTMGAAIGRDVIEKGIKLKPKGTFLVKAGMGAGIFLTAFLAYYLPVFFGNDGSAVIATGTSLFFGLCAATFLPLFAFGLFWKGTTKAGAVSGFLVGLCVSLFWLLFVYAKVSGGLVLCKSLFKVASIAGTSFWKDLDPLVVATPLAAIVTWIVSLVTKKLPEEHVKKVFAK
jgi:solute:Na+ symporter, SSS family